MRSTITIETRSGPRVVDVSAECETLACHRAHDGGRSTFVSFHAGSISYPWVLTHKGTGHSVGHFRTLKAARDAMRVAAGRLGLVRSGLDGPWHRDRRQGATRASRCTPEAVRLRHARRRVMRGACGNATCPGWAVFDGGSSVQRCDQCAIFKNDDAALRAAALALALDLNRRVERSPHFGSLSFDDAVVAIIALEQFAKERPRGKKDDRIDP